MNDEPVTCTFVYSAQEYEAGQKAAEKALPKTKNWKGIVILVIFFGFVFAVDSFCGKPLPSASPSGNSWTTALLNFGPVLLVVLLVIWLFAKRRKKSLEKFTYLDEQVTNLLSESGLHFESPLTAVTFKWPVFNSVLETDKGFVLISGRDHLFTWLPQSGFNSPDSIQRARELMRRQIANSKGLFPASPPIDDVLKG